MASLLSPPGSREGSPNVDPKWKDLRVEYELPAALAAANIWWPSNAKKPDLIKLLEDNGVSFEEVSKLQGMGKKWRGKKPPEPEVVSDDDGEDDDEAEAEKKKAAEAAEKKAAEAAEKEAAEKEAAEKKAAEEAEKKEAAGKKAAEEAEKKKAEKKKKKAEKKAADEPDDYPELPAIAITLLQDDRVQAYFPGLGTLSADERAVLMQVARKSIQPGVWLVDFLFFSSTLFEYGKDYEKAQETIDRIRENPRILSDWDFGASLGADREKQRAKYNELCILWKQLYAEQEESDPKPSQYDSELRRQLRAQFYGKGDLTANRIRI
jgi:chemotaxis protein histidine kinase CheA